MLICYHGLMRDRGKANSPPLTHPRCKSPAWLEKDCGKTLIRDFSAFMKHL